MKKRRLNAFDTACCTLAIILASSVASAQTTNPGETTRPASDKAAAQTSTNQEDIIVTAEKRPTLSRDVPGGVSAIDQQALNEARINDIEDATRLVPGFELGRSSGEQLAYPTIRGVSPQVFGDPTVAVLQDGFGFANSLKATTQDIFDASRVEVLKGPQSTLYGANSLGGVVNIISRLPSLTKPEADFRASYGEYDSTIVRGAASLPLINGVLGVRVGAYVNARDGYWDNRFNGREGQDATQEKGARGAVLFRPSETFESSLVYTFSHTSSDCSDCSNPIIGYDPLNATAVGRGTIDVNDLAEYTNTNVPGFYRRTIHRATWNNTLDLGAAKLTSLTGYGHLTFASLTDTDRGPGDTVFADILANERQKVFSEELRVTSDTDGPFRYQVGAYYLNSIDYASTAVNAGLPARVGIADGREKFENYAVFTQNAYEVSDRFEVQFGLRYDHAKKTRLDRITGQSIETSSNAWLPKVSALYRLDANNNVYATVSRGYKTGGNNLALLDLPPTYDPEYLWNYEAGLKGVSGDRRLRYDLSAYFIDWSNQQVQQAAGIFTYINNAGKTHIYGAEAALHYNITAQFSVDGTVSYNHSRYKDYFDPTATPVYFGVDPDRSGKRTFYAPDLSASLAGRYVQPIGGGYDVTLAGDARYTGKRSLDTEAILIGNAYVLTNLSISVGDRAKRLTLFANNAFDNRYSLAAFLFTGIPPVTHLGAPRVIGLQADFNF